MEESMGQGKQLLRVKPRSILLNWMRETVEDSSELVGILDKVNLQQMSENGSVVIKNFPSLENIKPFLEKNYRTIFEAEMSRMSDDPASWPTVNDFATFSRYFSIDIHTQLINFSTGG